jgi:hypothetical protein
MTYDPAKNRTAAAQRSAPAENAIALTAAMVADSDLATYAKSFRVYNMSAAAIVVAVTPLHADDGAKVSFTIGAGEKETIPLAVRRVWSTGSTGLAAGLGAGTVECQLYTE